MQPVRNRISAFLRNRKFIPLHSAFRSSFIVVPFSARMMTPSPLEGRHFKRHVAAAARRLTRAWQRVMPVPPGGSKDASYCHRFRHNCAAAAAGCCRGLGECCPGLGQSYPRPRRLNRLKATPVPPRLPPSAPSWAASTGTHLRNSVRRRRRARRRNSDRQRYRRRLQPPDRLRRGWLFRHRECPRRSLHALRPPQSPRLSGSMHLDANPTQSERDYGCLGHGANSSAQRSRGRHSSE